MKLCISSDVCYLLVSKARSRIAGYHYLRNHFKPNIPLREETPMHNAPIHVKVLVLKKVASSAADSELREAYSNSRLGFSKRLTLEEMGHAQLAPCEASVEVDNKISSSIIYETITQKCSKSMDMRYYWMRDMKR